MVAEIVTALADKYRVTEIQVRNALDIVLTSPMFRKATGAVFGEFTDDGILAYGENGLWLISKLKHNITRFLVHEMDRLLRSLSADEDFEEWHKIRGEIVNGTIVRVAKEGTLSVVITKTGIFGESIAEIIGICPLANQSPHERGRLCSGDRKWFYVNSVNLVRTPGGISAVRITLSRTSRQLPISLLHRELKGENGVVCTRRVAGKITYIKSEKKIEREVIQKIGKELGERLKVVYLQKEKPAC